MNKFFPYCWTESKGIDYLYKDKLKKLQKFTIIIGVKKIRLPYLRQIVYIVGQHCGKSGSGRCVNIYINDWEKTANVFNIVVCNSTRDLVKECSET